MDLSKTKYYQKTWFIPVLKSKYLTIELLKMTFSHKHEAVIFLRSLSKGSEYFMGRFYESEL